MRKNTSAALRQLHRDTSSRCFKIKVPSNPPPNLNAGDVWHTRRVAVTSLADASGNAALSAGSILLNLSTNAGNLPVRLTSISVGNFRCCRTVPTHTSSSGLLQRGVLPNIQWYCVYQRFYRGCWRYGWWLCRCWAVCAKCTTSDPLRLEHRDCHTRRNGDCSTTGRACSLARGSRIQDVIRNHAGRAGARGLGCESHGPRLYSHLRIALPSEDKFTVDGSRTSIFLPGLVVTATWPAICQVSEPMTEGLKRGSLVRSSPCV